MCSGLGIICLLNPVLHHLVILPSLILRYLLTFYLYLFNCKMSAALEQLITVSNYFTFYSWSVFLTSETSNNKCVIVKTKQKKTMELVSNNNLKVGLSKTTLTNRPFFAL